MTKKEQERLDRFNNYSKQLQAQGYIAKDITTTALKANLIGPLYGLILAIPFVVIFILIYRNSGIFKITDNYMRNYTIFIVLMFVFIVVHELLHGCSWALFTGDGFKSIQFGVMWKSLNPYCTCNKALTKKQYYVGLFMPCIVLGIIPCIISFFNHNLWFLIMGVIMMSTAGGDLLIGKLMLQNKSSEEALYCDHPTTIGAICFDKK